VVDALAAKTLPSIQRSVKWGKAYYGVGDINGTALEPVPAATPAGMGKSTRGVELESLDEIDEHQITAWMNQVTSVPGVGGKIDNSWRLSSCQRTLSQRRPSFSAFGRKVLRPNDSFLSTSCGRCKG
jgi:hypothetical protein